MKKIIFLLLFTQLVSLAYSQNAPIQIGQPYEFVKSYKSKSCKHNNQLVIAKRTMKAVVIQSFDLKTLNELVRTEIKMPLSQMPENLISVGPNLYFLYYQKNKETKNLDLYAQKINNENLSADGDPRRLMSSQTDGYSFLYSQDSSKLMISAILRDEVKVDSEKHSQLVFNVYDSSLKELSTVSYVMPFPKNRMIIQNTVVASNGDVHLLVVPNVKEMEKSIDYALFKIPLGQSTALKTDLRLPVSGTEAELKQIKSGMIAEAFDGTIYFSGLYQLDKSIKYDGFFFANTSSESVKYSFIEIPLSILNLYEKNSTQEKNEKKEAKGKAGATNLEILDIVKCKDGGVLINAEEHLLVERTSTNSQGVTTTSYTHYYGSLFISKVNKNGELVWMKKIPRKKLHGGFDVKHFTVGAEHYFIFLDNINNANLKEDMVPFQHVNDAGGFFAIYKIIDTTGEMSKEYLFDTRNYNGMKIQRLTIDALYQGSENEFFVELLSEKDKEIIMKITVK